MLKESASRFHALTSIFSCFRLFLLPLRPASTSLLKKSASTCSCFHLLPLPPNSVSCSRFCLSTKHRVGVDTSKITIFLRRYVFDPALVKDHNRLCTNGIISFHVKHLFQQLTLSIIHLKKINFILKGQRINDYLL